MKCRKELNNEWFYVRAGKFDPTTVQAKRMKNEDEKSMFSWNSGNVLPKIGKMVEIGKTKMCTEIRAKISKNARKFFGWNFLSFCFNMFRFNHFQLKKRWNMKNQNTGTRDEVFFIIDYLLIGGQFRTS